MAAAPPIISSPIQEHTTVTTVRSLLVINSSLLLGLWNGSIEQWDSPGEVERTFKGHSDVVCSLLQCGDILWSGSLDKTIRLWNLSSGEFIKRIEIGSELCSLVMWRDSIVSGLMHACVEYRWNTFDPMERMHFLWYRAGVE